MHLLPRIEEMTLARFPLVIALSSIVWFSPGCETDRGSQPMSPAPAVDFVSAIHDVLAIDGELGAQRNRATEEAPLVDAIRTYIAGIDSTDFRACPDDFTAAFQWHRDAWEASTSFFERYPDLRGEMHDLFEAIRSEGGDTQLELEQVEAVIWNSWAEVEAVAADYGAIEPPQGS